MTSLKIVFELKFMEKPKNLNFTWLTRQAKQKLNIKLKLELRLNF